MNISTGGWGWPSGGEGEHGDSFLDYGSIASLVSLRFNYEIKLVAFISDASWTSSGSGFVRSSGGSAADWDAIKSGEELVYSCFRFLSALFFLCLLFSFLPASLLFILIYTMRLSEKLPSEKLPLPLRHVEFVCRLHTLTSFTEMVCPFIQFSFDVFHAF